MHNNPLNLVDPTGMRSTRHASETEDERKTRKVGVEPKGTGWGAVGANLIDGGDIVNTTPSNQGDCPPCDFGDQKSSGGSEKQEKNPNGLNPSTLNQNLFGMHYPGGNNPQTYAGDPDFSTMPADLGGFPAIGHDRRYGNLGTAGLKGLLFDTRAVGADWKFVGEELSIASFSYSTQNYGTALKSSALGVGLGLFALPETIVTYSNPVFSQSYVSIWYAISNAGVTNAPSK